VTDDTTTAQPEQTNAQAASADSPADASGVDALGDLENIDFLLEEVENKIAPLALA
jgi:hypothetical protein